LRARLETAAAQNETIEQLFVIAPHGNDKWRTYVSATGGREGSVQTLDALQSMVAQSAWADPRTAYTASVGSDNERVLVTMRAVPNAAGNAEALVVSHLKLSEADRRIARDLTTSFGILGLVLFVVLVLFFRHARILDFAALYKKQVEIDQMKDSFLSMASHELKSPLSVIRGYVESLQTDTLDEGQRKEFMHRIELSADELRQLVDDILDVSRIEMGRLTVNPVELRPVEVLEEVVEMFSETARGKGLVLAFSVDDAMRDTTLVLDRTRLKQVMVNLASNAMKYTLEGTVTVGMTVDDAYVDLWVRDTGVGMTADEQKQLFGKFYRVEASETKEVRGTGLGLWITKYVTEHMHGTISVESIKGEGSRFVARFPTAKAG
jgi:signal transduction histidine kinase